MGGTDLADQFFQYYNHGHRSVKWWKQVFFHLLKVCIVNAHIVYASIPDNVKLTPLKFRQAVIRGLLEGWDCDQARRGRRSSRENLPAQLTQRGHFPGRAAGYPDCIVCSDHSKKGGRKQTKICCTKCDRPMCAVSCFARYHTNLHWTFILQKNDLPEFHCLLCANLTTVTRTCNIVFHSGSGQKKTKKRTLPKYK